MAYAFADACERAMKANDGVVTRATLRDAMETIDYDGVTGDISFNETHDWVRDYIMLEFKNGEFVLSE
jgi:ABC-type branched-subunit amino acid transport system substrate-binding protein